MTENLNVFAVRTLTQKEYFAPGHRACQGCAEVLAVRLVAKAVGRNVVVASATGCMEIVSSPLPFTSWRVPWFHVAFENAAAVASGVEAGLKAMMRKGKIPLKKIVTIGMAGDGGTADIGLQALSGALERGHDMIYICYDNEAYMNTGIQRSSSTPFGASTTTSPAGKVKMGQMTWKKNMPAIAAAHNIPYVATACPSYPIDLVQKVKKAANKEGPAYLHILSVCPTGWRSAPELSIRLGRLAAETGVFPLYEVEDGQYRLTIDFPALRPIRDYIKPQGRFRHLTDDMINAIEKRIHKEYGQLKEKAGKGV
ncbi:MAG: pyruvate ferredoxin oxidoreductase [Deltaproteobacteria bacterium RBG_13_52_11b]|nr:MAG: pyruvate ferredoxin oxidoreductase [Deltaproteobacteria bacterium RBG_13_52_11b]